LVNLRLTSAVFVTALLLPAHALAAPANTVAPSVSGDGGNPGNVLHAAPGSWTGSPSFAFQWQHCDDDAVCSDITRATAQDFTATVGDAHGYLQVVVTATDGSGSATATAVESRGSGPPRPARDPDWGDTYGDIGDTLTTAGDWIGQRPITASYQWGHGIDDSPGSTSGLYDPISGATGRSYVTTPGDWGQYMVVDVDATNAAGSWGEHVTVVPWPWGTPHVALGGDPWGILAADHYYVGDRLPLLMPPFLPRAAPVAFQWQRCDTLTGICTDIPGATMQDYRPTEADVGSSLQLTMTVSNDLGSDVEQAWSGIIEENPSPPATPPLPATPPPLVHPKPAVSLPKTAPAPVKPAAQKQPKTPAKPKKAAKPAPPRKKPSKKPTKKR
jgi:hypothetical protein